MSMNQALENSLPSPRRHSRLALWALLLACLSTMACFSVAHYHPEAPDDDSYFSLSDRSFEVHGTRFLVVTDNTQTDIHLEVRYLIGADQDPEGKAGLAHVVEHLLFEVPTSDLDDAESYGRLLARMSHSWNAFTTIDTTSYLTTLPKKNLVPVLNLEMMRAQRGCRGLTEETFLREREVVRNEARERDLGGPSLASALSEFLYPEGHPYRRSVIGTDATLTSLTLADACAFMEKHYNSHNRVIVVSGPVSPSAVSGAANALVGSALPEQTATSIAVPPISPSRKGTTIHLDTETPIVVASWRMAPVGTEAYRRQEQVLNGLGAALSTAADKKPWVRGAGVTRFGGAKAPAMLAFVAVSEASEFSAAEKLIEEARQKTLKKEGSYIHSYVLQRRLFLTYEDQESRTGLFADYLQYSEKGFRLSRHISELEEMKEEDIAKVARDLLYEPGNILRIQPKLSVYVRERSSFTLTQESPRQESFLEADAATVRAANQPLPLPKHVGAKQLARRYVMPNGLKLIFWVNHDLPLVHGRLVLPVGAADVPEKLAGLTNLLPGDDRSDVTVFSQSTLAKHAHGLMFLLASAFESTERIASDREMATYAESLDDEDTANLQTYRAHLLSALYGDHHPYTRTAITRASIGGLSKGVVEDWAEKHRSVRGATLILTGRFDPELMYRHALYYFGEKNSDAPPARPAPKALPTQGAVVTATDDDAASLGVSLYFRAAAGVPADMPARQLLSMIIRNRMQRLRESQALTYGIHVSFSPSKLAGRWSIRGDVDPARASEAMESLLGVIAELRQNPAGFVGEFANARTQLLASYNSAKPSAAKIASRLVYLTQLGLEDDYYEHYVRALAKVVPADVEALLATEFNEDSRVVGLFGPQASILAAKKAIAKFRYEPEAASEEPETPTAATVESAGEKAQ